METFVHDSERMMLSLWRMKPAKLFGFLALSFASMPALASTADQDATAKMETVHRLSPEQARIVQDTAAARNIDRSMLDDHALPKRRVHGEVGIAIGTGGYNSMFGTAFVPLGDDGFAALSLERSDFGRRRFRY